MSLLPARMPGAWNALEYRDSACQADRLIPTAPSRPFYQVPNGRDYRLASIHPSPCVRPHHSRENRLAPHLDVGFIQAPARIKATPPEPAQPLLHLRGVALDPAIDRRMVDRNAAFRQHFLKVAIA